MSPFGSFLAFSMDCPVINSSNKTYETSVFAKHFSFLSADLISTCLSTPLLQEVFPTSQPQGNSHSLSHERIVPTLHYLYQRLWHSFLCISSIPPHSTFLVLGVRWLEMEKLAHSLLRSQDKAQQRVNTHWELAGINCCCYCCCYCCRCCWGWQWWAWRWDACSARMLQEAMPPVSPSPPSRNSWANKGSSLKLLGKVEQTWPTGPYRKLSNLKP